MKWLLPAAIYTAIRQADPALAAQVFAPASTYLIDDPRTPPGAGGIGVARYRSFAQLRADLAVRAIAPGYTRLLYDPEAWAFTPKAEQRNPWKYLQQFGQCAHRHGYRVLAAPARDLGGVAVPGTRAGETLEDWYLRTELGGAAARYSDLLDVQAQALTLAGTQYERFVDAAARQARNANPYATLLAGISTTYGTAAQMAAAARSVQDTVAGYWLNASSDTLDTARAFLRLMA